MSGSISVKSVFKIFSLLLFFFGGIFCFAGDWILAGEKFTFKQHASITSAQNEMASLLPKLILEQFSSSSKRAPAVNELYDRKVEEKLNERVSLFLQLSSEVQKRDALFLSETNSIKLKNKISDQDKKISEIQKKIDKNLSECKELEKTRDEAVAYEDSVANGKGEISFFSTLNQNPFLFQSNEKVSLYKNGETLFDAGDKNLSERQYEKKVINEKINGLLKGTITVYNGYMMVNCELRVFPGNKVIGYVTEIGSMDDLIAISKNISQSLRPLIANAKPVDIYFDISPDEAEASCKLKVDGNAYNTIPEKISLNSGIHTLDFSCDGYNEVSITYNFEDEEVFLVRVPMSEKTSGKLNLRFKEDVLGDLYLNGVFAGAIEKGRLDRSVSINGKPYIGQIVSREHRFEEEEKESINEEGETVTEMVPVDKGAFTSFIYIPLDVQKQDANLYSGGVPTDLSSEINKRRIWMYSGYSALVVSMPFTLISLGKFKTAMNSYQAGRCDASVVQTWNTIAWISGGISITAGVFFTYELVRYLYTAGKVVPDYSVKDKTPFVVDENIETDKTEIENTDAVESVSENEFEVKQ